MLVVLLLSGHLGLHRTPRAPLAATRWALLMSTHSSGQEPRVLRPMGAWGPGGLSHPQPELPCVTWALGPPPSLLPARASSSLQMGTFTSVPQGPRGSVAQPPSRPRLSECPVW